SSRRAGTWRLRLLITVLALAHGIALQPNDGQRGNPGVDFAAEPHRLAGDLSRAREGVAPHQPPDGDEAQPGPGEPFRLAEQALALDRGPLRRDDDIIPSA